MSIFKRSTEANNQFANIFTKMAWVSMILNTMTLVTHYWNVYSGVAMIQRIVGSIVLSSLILGVEFAALTAFSDSSALEELTSGLKEGNNQWIRTTTGIGLVAVCFLAASVFYYDYTVNMKQFGAKIITFDMQILAGVLVIIAEIFFWIANICKVAGRGKKSGFN